MPIRRRFATAFLGGLAAATLVACGGAPVATPTATATASPEPTPAPTVSASAYGAEMCPIFDAIVQLDPRIIAVRDVGEADGDVVAQAAEIDALTEELRLILNDLEALPSWEPAGDLRRTLVSSLHAVRTQLLLVADDPAADEAAALLAATPFIASEAMHRGITEATEAGLTCAPSR